jgi:hypothetical protein
MALVPPEAPPETIGYAASIEGMTSSPGEPLPEGVLLTVPRDADGNCCGL